MITVPRPEMLILDYTQITVTLVIDGENDVIHIEQDWNDGDPESLEIPLTDGAPRKFLRVLSAFIERLYKDNPSLPQ